MRLKVKQQPQDNEPEVEVSLRPDGFGGIQLLMEKDLDGQIALVISHHGKIRRMPMTQTIAKRFGIDLDHEGKIPIQS